MIYDDDSLLTMELVEGIDFLSYVRPSKAAEEVPAHASDEVNDSTPDWPSVEVNDNTADWQSEGAAFSPLHSGAGQAAATLVQAMDSRTFNDRPDSLPAPARSRESVACSFDEERMRTALLQLCEGLLALHRADRLHRDLKPANVLVSVADARVIICDFGLVLEGRTGSSDAPEDEQSRFELRQREIAGTLQFMSPEQARGETLTSASDWYSVRVMLYLALTGQLPFPAALSYNTAVRVKSAGRPVHPAVIAPGIPGELAELALSMLHPIRASGRATTKRWRRWMSNASKRSLAHARAERCWGARLSCAYCKKPSKPAVRGQPRSRWCRARLAWESQRWSNAFWHDSRATQMPSCYARAATNARSCHTKPSIR